MSTSNKAVVLLSGGLDSSTLLYRMLADGHFVTPLSVRYGQRHEYEMVAASKIVSAVRLFHPTTCDPLVLCDAESALRPIFAGAESSQVGKRLDVPYGHYAAPSMKTTIVPNRNMVLLAIAGALAVTKGAGLVGYAAHAGDHPIYPDCRPEFATVLSEALALGTPDVRIFRPFIEVSKTDIVRIGSELGVPFELTYSCYEGTAQHCGACGTCTERKEAFRDAGVTDPTAYSA